MKKSKILYLMPNYRIGGVQNVVYGFAKVLKKDFDVTVIARGEPTQVEGVKLLGARNLVHLFIKVVFNRYDILHTHGNMSLLHPFVRAQKRYHHFHNRRINEEGMLRRVLSNFIFWFFRVRLISVSNQNNNAIVLYNSVGTPDVTENYTENIVWAGRNDWQKNFELFFDFSVINPEMSFRVFGRGFDTFLPQQNLRFMGEVDDLWALGLPRLLVMTSRFEGFPLLLLEAWARGVFVVCTPFLHDEVLLKGPVEISDGWSTTDLNLAVDKALGSNVWSAEKIKNYYYDNLGPEVMEKRLKDIYSNF